MAMCPKCNKTIDYLDCYAPAMVYFRVKLMRGQPWYEENPDLTDWKGDDEFYCPLCHEEVAVSEEQAVGILGNGLPRA